VSVDWIIQALGRELWKATVNKVVNPPVLQNAQIFVINVSRRTLLHGRGPDDRKTTPTAVRRE
jgi:hypothetical protein